MTADRTANLQNDAPSDVDLGLSVFNDGRGETQSAFLYEAWLVLMRRRYWFISILVIGLLAAYMAAKLRPVQYDSTAIIRISESSDNQLQLGSSPVAAAIGSSATDEKIETEIAVLQSNALALRVAQNLNLYNNPTFSPIPKDQASSSPQNPATMYRVLGAFRAAITVAKVPHTEAISITVRTRSPKLSAQIADSLVNEYIQRNYEVKFHSQQGVSDWLGKQLDDLRKQTEEAQDRALTYQKKLGLIGMQVPQSSGTTSGGSGGTSGGIMSPELQQVLGIQQSLVSAEADRLVKEAQYGVLSGQDPQLLPATSASVLQALRLRQTTINSQIEQLKTKFGPNYQPLKELIAELGLVNQQIAEQQKLDLGRARSEFIASRESERALQRAFNDAKQNADKHSDDMIQYTIAEREFESNYVLYEDLLTKLKEAGVLATLRSNDVDIIDPALIPINKSAPRTSLFVLVGGGISLLVGALAVMLLDALDRSILDGDLLEEMTGVATLGVIPKSRDMDSVSLIPQDSRVELDSSKRAQFESYLSLRTSLLLSHAGMPPRVIEITSSVPGEGKSTTALNLAFAIAQRGSKVLIIDADLRRPTLHIRLGQPQDPGLCSVLAGMADWSDCIRTLPDRPNFFAMLTGPRPPYPTDLLASKEFTGLLNTLRREFEFIIVDAPPVLSVSDPMVIATSVDGVLFLARSGTTSRNMVERACRTLRRSGAHILGGILNAVDYRSSEYAYQRYYDYYSSDNNSASKGSKE